MSEKTESNPLAQARVVLQVAGMRSVIVRRGIAYRPGDADAPTLDVRYPAASTRRGHLPGVVFVAGYPDRGFEAMIGCKHKDMPPTVSWAELAAASGFAAVTYEIRDPAADVRAVLDFVRAHAAYLGIDASRLALWACSGNVPNALAVMMRPQCEYLRCAVLCYGYMLDDAGSAAVAEGARIWGFANPCAGKSVDELPADRPLFIARAGRDEFRGVNESIDRFVATALSRNKPVTVVNVPDAPHAFDLFYNTEASREVVRSALAFLRFHLLP